MGKLSKLKDWLQLPEATDEVRDSLGDSSVKEADLLHMALHGKLRLSVVFADEVAAYPCDQMDERTIEFADLPNITGDGTVRVALNGPAFYTDQGAAMRPVKSLTRLQVELPYDLVMMGGERGDVQQRYWDSSGVERSPTTSLSGTFVAENLGHPTVKYFQLLGELERDQLDVLEGRRHYFPLGGLPVGCALVVRAGELQRFVGTILKPQGETGARTSSRVHGKGPWPWGAYETELLAHLAAAGNQFWQRFDPGDNSTAETNDRVSSWLQSRGVSKRIADVMATILRADGLPTGPRTSK